MKCKKCGQEIDETVSFCPNCGKKVLNIGDEVSETKSETLIEEQAGFDNIENSENTNDQLLDENKSKKKSIIIVAVIAVIAIIIVIIGFSNSNKNNNYTGSHDESTYSDEIDSEDDFGNDEVVTEPETTEKPTVAPIEDIKVVYDDVIYDKFGSKRGAITIDEYSIIEDSYGAISVYIDYEKVKEGHTGRNFSVNAYYYDANGTPIGNSQVCYVSNFSECEIGKKFKDEIYISSDIAESIAKIEIIGG